MVESIRNQNDYDASVNRSAGTRRERMDDTKSETLSPDPSFIRKMKLNTEDASLMIALLGQWRFSRGYSRVSQKKKKRKIAEEDKINSYRAAISGASDNSIEKVIIASGISVKCYFVTYYSRWLKTCDLYMRFGNRCGAFLDEHDGRRIPEASPALSR